MLSIHKFISPSQPSFPNSRRMLSTAYLKSPLGKKKEISTWMTNRQQKLSMFETELYFSPQPKPVLTMTLPTSVYGKSILLTYEAKYLEVILNALLKLHFLDAQFSSVTQLCLTLRPHGLQHASPPCPSPTPRVYSKLMSIESVMPSNHLILCYPLFLLPSIFPSIRVFSNESALRIRWPKYWSFNFNISH